MRFTSAMLPDDAVQATLAGRLLLDEGPTPVLIRDGAVEDVSRAAPTIADLVDLADPAAVSGERLFGLDELATLAPERFLAPVDLQAVKAAGVTFAISAIERVIEERARGDFTQAGEIRNRLEQRIGGAIRSVVPGSEAAARLKDALIEDGLWSQYLEVAIGPDAEIFTKTAPLASVGWGAAIGVRSDSTWNNPEPEVVLVVDSHGEIRGATLGNDVNLRDFEGRSALLLSKAKDNNASCAIGPFVRLFDDIFTLDDVRSAVVELEIAGSDGFRLRGQSRMSEISRDPEELVRQAMSEHHYPDGFVLFLGTLFAPTDDRDEPGRGFTHKIGDEVRISTPKLGTLANIVATSRDAPAWEFGTRALMRNLAARGLFEEATT
ncbi:fumarylacetoacetate hydrolase family protein [Sphingomonas segetis]|uniref:fumarylacetoacetate hydrolase family protein n=1 Tax=Sphingomonas segetis TaxID=1104779 RepID=UPI001E43E83B|nr:fumarylacetoacetate hydrolase family protein [Sphingomonas segetis]